MLTIVDTIYLLTLFMCFHSVIQLIENQSLLSNNAYTCQLRLYDLCIEIWVRVLQQDLTEPIQSMCPLKSP